MKLIDSVIIRYFRSVYTLTVSPCEDITVLTGKNDVGKSNILKALNLFFCNQSDYLHNFDFDEDYSILRKEEVRKDTIRGQQFISISIRFNRGERMINSLPPTFTVTKRWDMHSSESKMTSDVQERMKQYAKKQGIRYSEKTTTTFLSTFLNKIRYIYVPAVKDDRVFNGMLNILQQSLFNSKNKGILDAPIGHANEAVQKIVGVLQADFQLATGIQNFIELPSTLNYARGLLQVNTSIENGSVTIDKRGDGIRSHYIPKILDYVASQTNNLYIWGFEEPENSYEYRRCIQVAHEFENQYSKNSQIFLTSHSPAFFSNESDRKTVFRVTSDPHGKTVKFEDGVSLDEELGYIELYREFIEQVENLQKENKKQKDEVVSLKEEINQSKVPIVLTEGKTDTSLLILARERLKLERFNQWEIRPIKSDKTSNNEVLLKYLEELRDNMQPPMPVIGIFDRDTKLETIIDGKKIDIRDEDYVKISDYIYAFALPIPHGRKESDQISIEHYFTDEEIMTELEGKRLFLGNEFYKTGVYKGEKDYNYKAIAKVVDTIKIIEHETKSYVTKADGTGDFSISKARFVEAIESNKDGFVDFSFGEFRKVFDILERIAKECKIASGETVNVN